jgi:hypothetical protein
VLNIHLLLRVLLPTDYVLILILHAFIVSLYVQMIEYFPRRFLHSISHMQRSENVVFSVLHMILPLLASGFLTLLLSIALWQTLTLQFDLTDTAHTFILQHTYTWLPLHDNLTSLPPPNDTLFGVSLSKPNIFGIPIIIFVLSVFSQFHEIYRIDSLIRTAKNNVHTLI